MFLIIGIGNRLRQDDGFGPAVADLLQTQLGDRPEIEIWSVHQLLPEIAEALSQADRVILIDVAVQAHLADQNQGAGSLNLVPLDADSPQQSQPLTHHFSPQMLLGLAQAVYGRVPETWLLSARGQQFGSGETLSPPVQAAVPRAVNLILQHVPRSLPIGEGSKKTRRILR